MGSLMQMHSGVYRHRVPAYDPVFYMITVIVIAFEQAQLNNSKFIPPLLCFIISCLLKHVHPFSAAKCEYLCECLPEGLSWLQFNRVGLAPCLRSWLTMLVCKRWEKHPHPFSLDPRKKSFLGHG